MHLFKKCLKYAFAYALLQMLNYPKPTHYRLNQNLLSELLDAPSEVEAAWGERMSSIEEESRP